MAYRAGLENRIPRKRDGGSNPSLSATVRRPGFTYYVKLEGGFFTYYVIFPQSFYVRKRVAGDLLT